MTSQLIFHIFITCASSKKNFEFSKIHLIVPPFGKNGLHFRGGGHKKIEYYIFLLFNNNEIGHRFIFTNISSSEKY